MEDSDKTRVQKASGPLKTAGDSASEGNGDLCENADR